MLANYLHFCSHSSSKLGFNFLTFTADFHSKFCKHIFDFSQKNLIFQRNLADPANLPNGTRGYLTLASTTCLLVSLF